MTRSSYLACLTLAAALGQESTVLAAPAAPVLWAAPKTAARKKNVAVGKITGPNSAKVRVLVMKEVKESGGYDVTDAEDLKPGQGKAAIAKMVKVLEVDAVVMGTVTRNADLTLNVYGADGGRIEQVKIKGGSLAKLETNLASQFDEKLAEPLAEASGGDAPSKGPPPEEEAEEPEVAGDAEKEPEPDPEAVDPAEDPFQEPEAEGEDQKKPAEDESAAGRAPFELMAGMRGVNRAFEYNDPVGQRQTNAVPARTLVPYKLAFGPAFVASTRIYPIAFFRDDAWAHIGLMGDLDIGLATTTEVQSDAGTPTQELKTTFDGWMAGLRGRIPAGPVEGGVFAQYGSQAFILLGDEGGPPPALRPLVPDVRYNFIRVGLDARARFSRLLVGAHVAPRFLLSFHQIDLPTVWFPGATGSGLDFGALLGFSVLPFLDIVGGFDVVRYGFDFNDMPTTTKSGAPGSSVSPTDPLLAPLLAGGATDTYISGRLGLSLTLGGSSSK